jgi:hypothetical protein
MKQFRLTIGKSIIISFFFLLFFSTGVIGATYYVSPKGKDTANGSKSASWATIQYAASQAKPGDTVIVKDGVYTEASSSQQMVRISKSGTSSKWITFKAENKWGAVLDGGPLGSEKYFGFVIANGSKYIRFEDFEIKNVISAFRINATEVGKIHHITFYRCKINDVQFSGINSTAYSDYLTIDSCLIYNIRKDEDRDGDHQYFHNHGLYLKGKHNLIINNIIYEPQGGVALRIDGYSGTKMTGDDWSFKVINNVFRGTKYHSAISGLIGFYKARDAKYPPHGVVIENNLFIDPPDGGSGRKAIQVGTSNNRCDNPLSHWTPSKTKINYNVTNVDIMIMDCLGSIINSNSRNVTNAKEINLQDLAKHNYRPSSSSSDLINKGSCRNAPDYDFDQNQRPMGSTCDVGAYEFVNAGTMADSPEPPRNLEIIQ